MYRGITLVLTEERELMEVDVSDMRVCFIQHTVRGVRGQYWVGAEAAREAAHNRGPEYGVATPRPRSFFSLAPCEAGRSGHISTFEATHKTTHTVSHNT